MSRDQFIADLMEHARQVSAKHIHDELPALLEKVYNVGFKSGQLAAVQAMQLGLRNQSAPATDTKN